MIYDTDRACSACGKGRLRPRVDKEVVKHKGQTTELDVYHSVCDVCGIDLTNGDQMDLNVHNMVVFRKKVEGFLSGAEIRAIRKKLGLSKKEASKVFESGSIPFSEYESDQKTHGAETDRLLRQAAANPEAFMQDCDRLTTPASTPYAPATA